MEALPAPHPLDFDWRFDDFTAQVLLDLLRGQGPTLLVGAPSIARLLEAEGNDITLVDRQPIQNVRRQIATEAAEFIADRPYRTALVDPPWYPRQLTSWTEAAARAVSVGGTIFVSVWPSETRPNASLELASVIETFSAWAKVKRNVRRLKYQTPLFEVVARQFGKDSKLSGSPGYGELIELTVQKTPPICSLPDRPNRWVRFVLNDYQLAVRQASDNGSLSVESVPGACGWHWPFVSARASALESIDIWSSEGQVAMLGSPKLATDALRAAFASSNIASFNQALARAPELLKWTIPRPPYWRSFEWLLEQ